MYIKKVLTLIFLTAGICFQLSAQNSVNDSLKVVLEEIQVEAAYSSITIQNAPLSVSYLTRGMADITARPATTMDELTYNLPGIFISNRENYALGERVTIRGLGWRSQFGVRGIQVIMDDIPLTVADGQTIMSMIDPAMVQRIELLRGPSATFWGNSSGGVLYLSTQPPVDSPSLSYRGYAGSFNTLKQEIRWNKTIGSTRTFGYGSYFDTEGYRNHSAARLFRFGAGVEQSIDSNSSLQFNVNYTSMPKAQHPGSLNAEQFDETPKMARDIFVNAEAGKTFDQGMAALSYTRQFENGIFNVTTHGTYRDFENPLFFGYIAVERYAGGLRSTYQFDNLPFDLNLGGEIKIQRDDRLETDIVDGEPGNDVEVDQIEEVSNQALFALAGYPLTERLQLHAGLRADWLTFETDDDIGNAQDGSREFFSVNPSVGVNLEMGNSRFFANFSTSFESPTTTELVNRPEGGNGFSQNLNPEKTIGFETGIRGFMGSNSLQYDFTVFTMQVNDLLVPYEETSGGPTFFRNEGKTHHYGLESSIRATLTESLSWKGMLTLLSATFNGGEFDDNEVPGVTPFRAGSSIEYNPGNHHFFIDAEWIGSYQTNSENSESTSPYALFHARYTAQLPNIFENTSIRPFISLQNLFNTRYASSVAINAFGNRFYEPGSSRSVNIGLKIDLF